jgi:hypothetical protein|tara:strand:+ start:65 stop:256 length:192 start_codon:yes stop_codon:yes gene_type:complete
MIEQINLTDLSVNQMIAYYNHINMQDAEGYNKQKVKHDIDRIKNKLINLKVCGELLRQYEGRL